MSVVRGTRVDLVRAVGGRETVLGSVRSGDYVSNLWMQVSIRAEGNVLSVQVRRTDTGRYMDASGNWETEPVNAILVRDSGIAAGGQVGFARGTGSAGRVVLDNLFVNRVYPESRAVFQAERFDTEPAGALPDGWGQWTNRPDAAVRTTPDQSLQMTGGSAAVSRVWTSGVEPADLQVTSSLYLDSLVPAQMFVRGAGVDTARPTYYAASVTRGLSVQVVRVVNGQQTVLGAVRSATYVSGQWVQVSLVARGAELRAQVFRTDTAQYLQADGKWGLAPAWAVARTEMA